MAFESLTEKLQGVFKQLRSKGRLTESDVREAMKEVKVQEKLREHAFEEFVEEQKAVESKEIDELVSYRYGQKGTGV